MMRYLHGHLGAAVSPLVDGQLSAADAERAWSHVAVCESCRRLVEREGWVKRQLAALAPTDPPPRLVGDLHALRGAAEAWVTVDRLEHARRHRRRAGIALVGVGSVSAAVLGLAALSGTVGGAPSGPPAVSLTRPGASSLPTTAVVAPTVTVHGRLSASEDR